MDGQGGQVPRFACSSNKLLTRHSDVLPPTPKTTSSGQDSLLTPAFMLEARMHTCAEMSMKNLPHDDYKAYAEWASSFHAIWKP